MKRKPKRKRTDKETKWFKLGYQAAQRAFERALRDVDRAERERRTLRGLGLNRLMDQVEAARGK